MAAMLRALMMAGLFLPWGGLQAQYGPQENQSYELTGVFLPHTSRGPMVSINAFTDSAVAFLPTNPAVLRALGSNPPVVLDIRVTVVRVLNDRSVQAEFHEVRGSSKNRAPRYGSDLLLLN